MDRGNQRCATLSKGSTAKSNHKGQRRGQFVIESGSGQDKGQGRSGQVRVVADHSAV
jgi:hypothetical protein